MYVYWACSDGAAALAIDMGSGVQCTLTIDHEVVECWCCSFCDDRGNRASDFAIDMRWWMLVLLLSRLTWVVGPVLLLSTRGAGCWCCCSCDQWRWRHHCPRHCCCYHWCSHQCFLAAGPIGIGERRWGAWGMQGPSPEPWKPHDMVAKWQCHWPPAHAQICGVRSEQLVKKRREEGAYQCNFTGRDTASC